MGETKTEQPGSVSYRVSVSNAEATDGLLEMLVYRSVVAGVCGPHGGCTLQVLEASTTEDVFDDTLEAGLGFRRTSEWRPVVTFEGLMVEADCEVLR